MQSHVWTQLLDFHLLTLHGTWIRVVVAVLECLYTAMGGP